MGTSAVDASAPLSRKARRKQERKARKQKKAPKSAHVPEEQQPSPTQKQSHIGNRKRLSEETTTTTTTQNRPNTNKRRRVPAKSNDNKKKQQRDDDPYAHMNPALAAAMRRDDEEIATLEAKLGLSSTKDKARLNREYAKLEGYGDDFGEFLDGLDDMVQRVTRGGACDDDEDDEDVEYRRRGENDNNDEDSSLESPYHSSEEGDMDHEMSLGEDDDDNSLLVNDDDGDSMEEEVLPMKAPAVGDSHRNDDEEDEDSDASESASEGSNDSEEEKGQQAANEPSVDASSDASDEAEDEEEKGSGSGESDQNDSEDNEEDNEKEDVDPADTYRPTKGEDIYGNVKDTAPKASASKYVPPHLRKKRDEDSQDRKESLRAIERALNNSLNRLSEDNVLSVAQTVAKLYESHSKSDLNDSIWKITRNTCVERSFLMTGLTPVYVAALLGVHHLRSSAQLAEHLMELVTRSLCEELVKQQEVDAEEDQDPEMISKKACNLALVLCYLYNYGVVHCNLLYDIIRKLIDSFHEVDVEVLLIFLSHCGRSLRSDDPLALKEIVLEVQKRATQDSAASSSRVDYMLSAMMDLKNNKRRAQDAAFADKTSKLRKSIGHIKSRVATSNGKANDNSLRITLKDIMEADTKGRWWRVGASWAGNQLKYQEGEEQSDEDTAKKSAKSSSHEQNEKLLKLASKYRMNSDIRRSIFCIIMGAADCDDAFEKIVRAGVLKNRNERDTVRVLMECCGNEKVYNKFYEHLANRICEYQSRCRFTFQLAFWDIFKQFDEMKLRKAANLAKLLFALVAQHQVLKLNVLKAIDMTTPEELSETATIFLTIFFTNLMEYFQDETGVTGFFASAIHQGNKRVETDDDDDELGTTDEAEALRASFTLFFVQVLKSSPKYKKGSKFRANLKAAIKACDTDNFF